MGPADAGVSLRLCRVSAAEQIKPKSGKSIRATCKDLRALKFSWEKATHFRTGQVFRDSRADDVDRKKGCSL